MFTDRMRKYMLARLESSAPTRIMALSEVKRVSVFIDRKAPGFAKAKDTARSFFENRNMEITFLCPGKDEIDNLGCLRRQDGSRPDMFLSVAPASNFTSEYAARCSTASFKVGRTRLEGDIFNIVFEDPKKNKETDQDKAMEYMLGVLDKIV